MPDSSLPLGALEADLKPQARRVLSMLRAAGERGVSNGDFIRSYIERFGGRICEMRKLGWSIETTREGQGRSRYFLRAEPSGVRAGVPPSPASADPGGTNPVRSKNSEPAAGVGEATAPSGGGSLFDPDTFLTRRGYADPEEAALA